MSKKLKEVMVGEQSLITVLVTKIEELTTKSGDTYCKLEITDGETSDNLFLWQMNLSKSKIHPPQIISAEIQVSEYHGNRSLKILRYGRPKEKTEIRDFIRTAPISAELMYEEIINTIRQSSQKEGLSELTEKIFEAHKKNLTHWSGAKFYHHKYISGLLYHLYRMIKAAEEIAKIYDVDAELLVCGAALHDIGKLEEFTTDPLGNVEYSVAGSLFGHLYLGGELLDKFCKKIEEEKLQSGESQFFIDQEKLQLLKHILVSHHGNPEYGAVTTPKIKEAWIIHYLDVIDVKVEQIEEAYKTIHEGETGKTNSGEYCYRSISKSVKEEESHE